jgi:hypothetical protein
MIARENALIPVTPAADHTGLEGYFVNNSSGTAAVCSSTSDVPLGVITEGQDTDGKDSIALSRGGFKGTVKIKIGSGSGDVSAFDLLQLNNDGTVNVDAGTGSRTLVAQAVESGVAGDLIEAIIFPSYTAS